eukprot:COSAG01_NODE_2837_length_6993_cov_3.425733_4_plen_76_part_00
MVMVMVGSDRPPRAHRSAHRSAAAAARGRRPDTDTDTDTSANCTSGTLNLVPQQQRPPPREDPRLLRPRCELAEA